MSDFNDNNKWVTVAQAQQYLNVKRTKMWQLRKDQELKYSVCKRKVYVLRRSIDEYIERHTVDFDFTQKGGSDE